MSRLTLFYSGHGTDGDGRKFDDIITMSDSALDAAHSWIQWVFPTKQPSNFNEDAPLLTDEDVVEFRGCEACRTNFHTAYVRFLRYLGLAELANGQITTKDNFEERRKVIWGGFNHNYLRVTRFLTCLKLVGESERSKKILSYLMELDNQEKINISSETRYHWSLTQ